MDERNLQKRLLLAIVVNIAVMALEVWVMVSDFRVLGWKIFSYYTELSNLLAFVACGLGAAYSVIALMKKDYIIPEFVKIIKFVAASLLTVIFFVVLFVLTPHEVANGASLFSLVSGTMLFSHIVIPLLVVADFVFLAPAERLEFPVTFIPLIASVLYAVVIFLLCGLHVIDAPYFFLDIRNNPTYLSILYIVGITAFIYLVSFFLRKLDSHFGPCIH